MFKNLKQTLKFGLIGILNTFINLIVFYFLTSIVGIYYIISAIFAFFVANINSFVWNKTWTFEEKFKTKFRTKYFKFLSVSLLALGINIFFLYIFVEYLHWHYLFSQFLAICLSFSINFFLNKSWTFKI